MSQLKVNSIIPTGGIASSGGDAIGGGVIQVVQDFLTTTVAITSVAGDSTTFTFGELLKVSFSSNPIIF